MKSLLRKRSRITVLVLLAAIGTLLLAGSVLAHKIATSKPPSHELESARAALDGARTVQAQEYAAPQYEVAESRFDRAYRAYRSAEARLFGYRDYTEVVRKLEEARQKANEAMDSSLRRRDEERARSAEMIASAEAALKEAKDAAPNVPFGSAIHVSMARAEVILAEARLIYRRGSFPAASERASVAMAGLSVVNNRIDTFLTQYSTGKHANQWQRWISDVISDTRRSGTMAVVVEKMNRLCHLYRGGRLVRSYPADLGGPLRQKMRAGDRATPEGRYRIIEKRGRGQTRYYKALMINYPNEDDRQRFLEAKRNGWIPRRSSLGGLIEIHGGGGRNYDWTLGCVALRNQDMDELFDRVQVGTPVVIVGSIKNG